VTRILQIVDDVLEASDRTRARAAAEVASVKEASAAPFTEVAKDLRSLAATLRSDDDSLSYSDFGGLR
jgi:hypothetical protein